MKLHIGKEIEKKAKEKRVSTKELGTILGTSQRTIQLMYNSDDILTSRLQKLSEVLEFNFFELFNPVIAPKPELSEPETAQYEEREYSFTFTVHYPLSKTKVWPTFMHQVHATAAKMGFRMG